MSWIFFSDLHLDSDNQILLQAFENLLKREMYTADKLNGIYILGDLCEVWVGDDDDSELISRIRTALRTISVQVPVYFLPGNRDFLLGEQFARSAGMQILQDPCVIELAETKILLAHGDAFCTEDYEYQNLRKVLRGGPFREQVLARSLAERRQMAASLRAESRTRNSNKPDNIMDVSLPDINKAFTEHGVKHFVHGHTHRPGIHIDNIGDQTRFRYVLGDWGWCGWLLRFTGETFQMECFPVRIVPSAGS